MKLFVLALFISFALCVPATVDVDTLHDVALRLSFDVDAQINATQASILANLNASFTSNIGTFLQSLAAFTQSSLTTLNNQLTSAEADFQAAVTAFLTQSVTINGTVNGLAVLVQQVGDAKAAIELECQALQQLAVEAAAANKASLALKLQASVNETQKSMDLSAQLLILQVTPNNADAQTKAAALLVDLSFAKAKGQVYASLSGQIQSFIGNNTSAVTQCRVAIQQRIAALALGITADWNTVKQQVSQDVADFKSRIATIVSRVVGDSLQAIQVLNVQIDDVTRVAKVQVSISVDAHFDVNVTATLTRILKAAGVAICGGNVDVSVVTTAKRQAGSSATFQLALSGSAQIDLASLGLAVQTDLSAAVSTYQGQVAASLAAANASIAALRLALKNITLETINAATATVQAAFDTANQAWNDAKTAWNAKVAAFENFVATAKQTILNAVAAAKDQATQLLTFRKSQLDAKIAELNASVDQFKANLQSLALDEQTIKSAILSAQANLSVAVQAGNVDLQAQLNASISVLFDTYGQKVAASAVVQVNLDGLQGNLTAIVAKIKAEQDDIDARITAFKGQLATTIDNIKARLTANEAQIQARLQEVANALDSDIQSVTATFKQLSASVSVSVSVNFGANVTTDEIKAFIAAYLKAEFTTDNVVVTLKGTAKRSVLDSTATYDATVGAPSGVTAGPSSDATSSSAVLVVLLFALIMQLLW